MRDRWKNTSSERTENSAKILQNNGCPNVNVFVWELKYDGRAENGEGRDDINGNVIDYKCESPTWA
jgi:hypothetical protein